MPKKLSFISALEAKGLTVADMPEAFQKKHESIMQKVEKLNDMDEEDDAIDTLFDEIKAESDLLAGEVNAFEPNPPAPADPPANPPAPADPPAPAEKKDNTGIIVVGVLGLGLIGAALASFFGVGGSGTKK